MAFQHVCHTAQLLVIHIALGLHMFGLLIDLETCPDADQAAQPHRLTGGRLRCRFNLNSKNRGAFSRTFKLNLSSIPLHSTLILMQPSESGQYRYLQQVRLSTYYHSPSNPGAYSAIQIN